MQAIDKTKTTSGLVAKFISADGSGFNIRPGRRFANADGSCFRDYRDMSTLVHRSTIDDRRLTIERANPRTSIRSTSSPIRRFLDSTRFFDFSIRLFDFRFSIFDFRFSIFDFSKISQFSMCIEIRVQVKNSKVYIMIA